MSDQMLFSILRSWSWQPLILLGLAVVATGYTYSFYYFWRHGWLERLIQRGLIKRSQPWYFAAGLAVIVIALLSPIDALADMLFMAHMFQHTLLMMVAPPLLLLGLPVPLIRWLIHETKVRSLVAGLTFPLAAFALLNLNFLVWHIPAMYEAALRNEFIHDLEHMLFFYTALFYWWCIIDPTGGWFSLWHWPPAKWVFLLVAAPSSYILGSVLWGSRTVWYPFYLEVPRIWGISALADQRYGGMLMWLQGWMFVMASMLVFFLWYHPEQEQA